MSDRHFAKRAIEPQYTVKKPTGQSDEFDAVYANRNRTPRRGPQKPASSPDLHAVAVPIQ